MVQVGEIGQHLGLRQSQEPYKLSALSFSSAFVGGEDGKQEVNGHKTPSNTTGFKEELYLMGGGGIFTLTCVSCNTFAN